MSQDVFVTRGKQATQTLALNIKLIARQELGGFGGIGEGMGLSKTPDGQRILQMNA